MQEATQSPTIDSILEELEQVLVAERRALIQVNAEGIELYAQRKSALNDAIRERKGELTPAHQKRLRTIHQDVRHNLILLVHAREYVQTTIGLLTGQSPTIRPFAKPASESVRLDLRG